MAKRLFHPDGSELKVVRLAASKEYNKPAGFAVQEQGCDYYRTELPLTDYAAWVRWPVSAERYRTKAQARRLAIQTANGEFDKEAIWDGYERQLPSLTTK